MSFDFLRVRWAAALLAAGGAAEAAETAAGGQEQLVVDGAALLRDWVPPAYPADALKAKRSGIVEVRLIVDKQGKVVRARALEDSDDEFVEPALAAVRSWGFAPALDRGKEVACCLDTQVMFSPVVGQQKPSPVPPEDQTFAFAPTMSPRPRTTPAGRYPEALLERKIAGSAVFAAVVSSEGRALNPRILAVTHADFVLPALEALERWEFAPGMQGDLEIESEVQGRVTFDEFGATAAEVLAANGITGPDGGALSHQPLPLSVADVAWPVERLLNGEGGSATVTFTVSESGRVRDVAVKEATHPEFGDALAAAMEMWRFEQPFEPGSRVSVAMEKRMEFRAVPPDISVEGDPLARLVQAMRAGEIGTAKGLDEKPTPVYRVAPSYPKRLLEAGAPSDRAEIEFVIDREGRVRLPRVTKTTHEEFGWPAATAVAQWVFRAPRRNGEPVDVKVRIPVEFSPPKE